jgi:hypothetical protein
MMVRVVGEFAWGYRVIELISGRKIDLTKEQIDSMVEDGRLKRGRFCKGKTVIILPLRESQK